MMDETNRKAQTENQAPISSEPDEISWDRVRSHDEQGRHLLRLKSTGRNTLVEDCIVARIEKHGTVIYQSDALGEGYVGSWSGGPIQELLYEIGGNRRYMYTLVSSDIDTFQEESWCTNRRMTANAVADTILKAREMAMAELHRIARTSGEEARRIAMNKVALTEFGPASIWFTSLGFPTGTTITVTGIATDDMGDSWEVEDDWDGVPASFGELTGAVSEAGDEWEWEWDGKGRPTDWNGNTVRRMTAQRKHASTKTVKDIRLPMVKQGFRTGWATAVVDGAPMRVYTSQQASLSPEAHEADIRRIFDQGGGETGAGSAH